MLCHSTAISPRVGLMFSEPQFPHEFELNYKTAMELYEKCLRIILIPAFSWHVHSGLGVYNNLIA